MMNKKVTTSLLLTGLLIYVPISTSFAVDPAPAEFDKSGNTSVGQALDFAATVAAQLWLSVRRKKASKGPIKARGRNFFIRAD